MSLVLPFDQLLCESGSGETLMHYLYPNLFTTVGVIYVARF